MHLVSKTNYLLKKYIPICIHGLTIIHNVDHDFHLYFVHLEFINCLCIVKNQRSNIQLAVTNNFTNS